MQQLTLCGIDYIILHKIKLVNILVGIERDSGTPSLIDERWIDNAFWLRVSQFLKKDDSQ